MKLYQKLTIKGTGFLVLLLFFVFNSCKKSKSNEATDKQGSGPAKVIVQMLGIDENSGSLAVNGAGGGKLAVNAEKIQTQVVPFNEDFNIEATLVPVGIAANSATTQTLSTNTTKPALKTDAVIQTELGAGITYRLIAYDASGNIAGAKDYAYGSEAATGYMALNAGQTYTFVAYSTNTTAAVPPLSVPAPFASAAVNGVSGDLMYFKTTLTLIGGNNNLSIVLKHMYNLITPTVTLGADITGNIDAISNVQFGGTTKASASINFSTGIITYPTANLITAVSSSLTGIGTGTVTGTPILVINPGTSAGGSLRLAIGSITIAGITKTNLSITGLTITPGVKYNLILTIQRSCGTVNWSAANEFNISAGAAAGGVTTVTQSYTYLPDPNRTPITTVVFYVAQLDESFQMTINGLPLLTGGLGDNEFRFNPGTGANAPNVEERASPNRRFGVGAVPTIQASSTTAAFQLDLQRGTSPALGLTSAALGLLRFIPSSGYTFNAAAISSWNTSGTNTVKITQKLIGATTVFQARTAVVVPCTN